MRSSFGNLTLNVYTHGKYNNILTTVKQCSDPCAHTTMYRWTRLTPVYNAYKQANDRAAATTWTVYTVSATKDMPVDHISMMLEPSSCTQVGMCWEGTEM